MDIDFQAHVEMTLNNLVDRVRALEEALVQVPQIDFEQDPSRPKVVKVTPSPMRANQMAVPK